MDRRRFIKLASVSSAAMATLPSSFNVHAAMPEFNGKFVFTIQARGGWDITSFFDPKENVTGEDKINQWADSGETQTAGNIAYAPIGNNKAFFDKYHKDIMVINGIDAQTNSHTAGVVHNWSGRLSEGFPSITALYSAINAPELPISYINNGGYGETRDLIRYTQLDNVNNLNNIIYPNQFIWNSDSSYLHQEEWDLLTQARQARLARQTASKNVSVREKLARANYQSSIENSSLLKDLATTIANAGELKSRERGPNNSSTLKRQMQLALLSMKSGVSSAADLVLGGFDTHDDNDERQLWLIDNLTDSIDYLFTYAEELNIADRVVVVMMSDFSRTPRYNDDNGKDHWPISSALVMERDATWGNRVVGQTDEGHNTLAINPTTWAADENGSIIYPKHVIQSIRSYLNIDGHGLAQPFAFNNSENFDFFGN